MMERCDGRSSVRFRAAALSLALAAAAVSARAEPPAAEDASASAEVRTAARDLAQQGAEAFDRRDYAVALDRFTRADSLFPAPTLALMRARALRALGRQIEALDVYESTHRTALAADAPEAYRHAVEDARRESAELWQRIPRLKVHVSPAQSPASGLAVTLDGKPIPPALLDVERPVDPGPHEIAARADGHDPASRTITLGAGDRYVLEIPLVESAARDPAPAAPPPSATTIDDGARPGTPVVGWVTAGVGGALLATSAVTGLIALDKKSSLDDTCRPGCPPRSRSDIDAFRTHRTLSYASLGIGAASLGIGAYLILSAPSDAPRTALVLGPEQVLVRGRF